MPAAPESHGQERRGERNQLLALPLLKTSHVKGCLQKEDKGGQWPLKSPLPPTPRPSGDWAESILSPALTCSRQRHRGAK